MPNTKAHSRVGVFLSYAHEDNDILQAVHRAFEVIRQQTHQQLEIFYDKKSIDEGDIFDNTIRDALRNSDYLIILYTGAYKKSHSYTGFEVGYFVSLMDDEMQTSGNTSRRIVSMFVDDPPATTKGVQGIDLAISTDELSSNRDIYMERVRTNVDNDPLTRFFNSVADKVEEGFPKDIADDGTLSKERLERFQAVQKIVPMLRGEMYDCLSSREARRSIEQRLIIFELPKGSAKEADETVPDNATLTQRGKAFEVFGIDLENDTIFWRDFKEGMLSRSGTSAATILAIERAFITAVSPKTTTDNEQIIRGFEDNRIYRLIVTQHFDYYDGRKVLYMYLIEALGIAIFGDNKTSIILGLINIAAKYRSIFIEPESELSVTSFKIEKKPPKEMQEKVRKLVRELFLIEDESRVLKLDTTASIITYSRGLNLDDILELQKQWFDGRQRLLDVADTILHENPESDEFAERSREWLLALEEFSSVSHKVNSTITLQALENLKEAFR
jgi:TIR domain